MKYLSSNFLAYLKIIFKSQWTNNFKKFALVGLFNSFVNYAVFTICIKFFNFHYILSGGIGFCVAVIPAYYFNSIWSFRDKLINFKKFLMYLFISISMLILHTLTIFIVVNYLYILEIFSQLFGIAVTTLFNFILVRNFVFK